MNTLRFFVVVGISVASCGGSCNDSGSPGTPDPDDPLAMAIAAECNGLGGDPPPEPAPPAASTEGNVVTYPATSLGLTAFSANGRIQPRGLPAEHYFEYGPTTAYGSKTPVRPLAPRLAAFYRESWETGLAGWKGGSGSDLVHVPSGGVSGGFVRYAEPTGHDYNHVDGIGILHIVQYMYPAPFFNEPSAGLGGDRPDVRDARVRVSVRGNNWLPRGTELLWWSQIDVWRGKPPDGAEPRLANWAHTGFVLTDALASGQWENVEYRLHNDTTQWTYAGTNAELNAQLKRSVYHYAPLDETLSRLDINLFHLLAYVDPYDPPKGSIDIDELEIAFRNHSLVFPSNGGKIASVPSGSDDPATLTDGWRNGPGHTWKSAPSPQSPQEIVYDFERPVTIDRVQIHQSPEWPSKGVEVLASPDGVAWTSLVDGVLPENTPAGPNFAFLLAKDLTVLRPMGLARKLKVRVTSGYRPERWGLGEIEVFGAGAVMKTDDDWYRVNADISDLAPVQTYHYRLVAVVDGRTELGGDMTFEIPASPRPEVATGSASRVAGATAKLEGRMSTLGVEARVFFEYGPDATYGYRTKPKRSGPEITPRTVVETLTGLTPGATVHYRLVASGVGGTRCGRDATFVAR